MAVGIPGATAGATRASLSQQQQSERQGTAGRQGREPAIPLPDTVSNSDIILRSQTSFVGAGDTFDMVLELADATPDTRFTITLHRAVTSRIQFGQTLGGDQLGPPIQQFNGIAVSDLPTTPTGGTAISLQVPRAGVAPNPFTLLVTEPGVYPVTVSLDTNPTATPLITHVVRLGAPAAGPGFGGLNGPGPADDPLFSVGVLLNIDRGSDIDGLGEVLASHPDVVVTLLANPQSLAALSSSGPSGAATVTDLASAIGESQVLTSSWVPVDMGGLVAGGLEQFLDRQLLTGSSTLQQLLGVDVAGDTWVMDASVDPRALSALVDRGVRQVVIPEQLAGTLDSSRFPITLTRPFVVDANSDTIGNRPSEPRLIPAMQTDLVLADLLTSSAQPALAANRVLADLAVLAFDLEDVRRGAVVEAAMRNVDAATLGIVLSGLRQASRSSDTIEPLMQARTIGGLFATSAAVGGIGGEGQLVRSWTYDEPGSLGDFPEQLAEVDDRTGTLVGTIMPGPTAPEANTTMASVNELVMSSGDRTLADTARSALLEEADRVMTAALAPIGVPEQGSVTMTADAGVIPVTLQNGRGDPVRVQLQLTSDKLEFPNGDTVELVLEPGTNRREVEVRLRASGGFPVEIRLSSADGSTQLGQGRFTVRSTAISGTGLILSLLAGVFLAGWWALHFRSARRSRQLVTVTSDDASDPPDADQGDGSPNRQPASS
jgi:hypothetical protein